MDVRLGNLEPGSVAPAVYGLVERGVLKRPELAGGVACDVELRLHSHPTVRLSFGRDVILVEDAPPSEAGSSEPAGAETALADVELEADAGGPPLDDDPDTLERAARFEPDLVVTGSLPDVVAIMAAPLMGGLPRGLGALRSIAAGRVRFRGSPRLVRRLLRLLQI